MFEQEKAKWESKKFTAEMTTKLVAPIAYLLTYLVSAHFGPAAQMVAPGIIEQLAPHIAGLVVAALLHIGNAIYVAKQSAIDLAKQQARVITTPPATAPVTGGAAPDHLPGDGSHVTKIPD